MTKELFLHWVDYFVTAMEKAGYGRKHRRNMQLLFDGHNSRWTWIALKKLISHGFFPFCIGSHSSAWHQPDDDGPNAMLKGILGRVIHDWRVSHPFCVMDRAVYNRCLAEAVVIMKQRLAAELAAWNAKHSVWMKEVAAGNDPPPLVGKQGNVITRAWARCGWFPLKKDSENWKRVIPSLGSRYVNEQKIEHALVDMGKGLQIRELAWQGYNDNFLQLAKTLTASHERRTRRRHASVVDTRTGRGFTCEQDIQFLKAWEEKKREEAEAKALRVREKELRQQRLKDKRREVLDAALKILDKHPQRADADSKLRKGHYVQLLAHLGKRDTAYETSGPRKGKLLFIEDLRDMYWRYHVPKDTQEGAGDSSDTQEAAGDSSDTQEADGDSSWDSDTQEEDQQSESVPYLVGDKVKVFWPGAKFWYDGVVTAVDQADGTYDDLRGVLQRRRRKILARHDLEVEVHRVGFI